MTRSKSHAAYMREWRNKQAVTNSRDNSREITRERVSRVDSREITQTERDELETLNLEVKKRLVKRQLKKLDNEDAEAEHQVEIAAQREERARELELESSRLQHERENQQRECEREQMEFLNAWLEAIMKSLPQGVPSEIALSVQEEVGQVLRKLTPAHPHGVVQRLAIAAREKALKPWRRQQEDEQLILEARRELPFGLQTFSDWFPPNEWENRAMSAAREALAKLPSDSLLAERRAAAVQAARQIAARYESEQAHAQAEQEARQAKARVEFEAQLAAQQARNNLEMEAKKHLDRVFYYLAKLQADPDGFDFEGKLYEYSKQIAEEIKPVLIQELPLDFSAGRRRVEQLVDEWLAAHCLEET